MEKTEVFPFILPRICNWSHNGLCHAAQFSYLRRSRVRGTTQASNFHFLICCQYRLLHQLFLCFWQEEEDEEPHFVPFDVTDDQLLQAAQEGGLARRNEIARMLGEWETALFYWTIDEAASLSVKFYIEHFS